MYEFRGSPNRVNSVLKEQGNPLRIGGDPVAVQGADQPEKKTTTTVKSEDKKEDEKADKKSDNKAKSDDKKKDDKKKK